MSKNEVRSFKGLEEAVENSNLSWKKWEKPGDPHLINRIQWGKEELTNVLKVFEADWFGHGKGNQEFEKALADYTQSRHIHLTNSGSAAIDLAIRASMSEGRLEKGDLIIHPITTFPTSISSSMSLGLNPILVETKPNTYVVDPKQIEKAINTYPEARGAVIPHLLGNIPDMEKIKEILGERVLIEDSCDTLGGKFNGKPIGSFGDYTAYSFYGSHHITSGGVGGAVATPNRSSSDILKSLIFWGRDFKVGNDFLDRYTYATIGTDSQMSAIQAAFGLAQLKKLPEFVGKRREQFEEIDELFSECPHFELPEVHPDAEPSWFAYPLVVKEDSPFSREDFVKYLSDKGIETRPLMCGNLLEQRPYKKERIISLEEKFPIGEAIQDRGLFIPAWGMPEDQKENYHSILKDFISKNP